MAVISSSRWAGQPAEQQQQEQLPLRMDASREQLRTRKGTWQRQDQLAIDVRLQDRTQHDAVCAIRICPAGSGAAQASRCTLTGRDLAF